MSDLVSSALPGGYNGTFTADLMNRLWADLHHHHDHDGTGRGAAISHASVTDGAIADTYLTHARLSKHVQGAGTSSDPDNPGGPAGVHGLLSNQYVLGITQQQLVAQVGTGTTDRWDGDTHQQRGRGTFGVAFAEIPVIVWCVNTSGESATTTVYQKLTTSFAVKFRFRDESSKSQQQTNVPFVWIAWGVLKK